MARERGLEGYIEFIRGWFSCMPPYADKKYSIEVIGHTLLEQIAPLDFIFIDGNHSVISVVSDFSIVMSYLKVNGILAFHDFYSWTSVMKAIGMLLSESDVNRMLDYSIFKSHNGIVLLRKVRDFVTINVAIKDRKSQQPIAGGTLYNKEKILSCGVIKMGRSIYQGH